MKLLLINSIENARTIIDLGELSRGLSKSASQITFRDIVSRTIKDSRAWHLHCLADGSKLERLPENARAADFGYPQMLFWVKVAGTAVQRQAPAERRYEVRHGGYYELGLKIGTFIEWVGLSWDIFRSRAGRGFWLTSAIFVLAGLGAFWLKADYRLLVPLCVVVPFVYLARAGLTAALLMRELWPQVKTSLR